MANGKNVAYSSDKKYGLVDKMGQAKTNQIIVFVSLAFYYTIVFFHYSILHRKKSYHVRKDKSLFFILNEFNIMG